MRIWRVIAANDDELLVLQAGRHDACCDVLKVGETGVERGKERRQPSEDPEQKIATDVNYYSLFMLVPTYLI